MSRPRQILPGSTYLLTRRCVQRQFLLRPSEPTNEIFLYCLSEAARKFEMKVHAYCVLSNHYHLVVTDPHARLPEFMRWLNEFVAKCLNAQYGRWEAVWASGTYSAVRLEASVDVLDKVAYTLNNPVQAELVRTGQEWPGLRSHPQRFGGVPLKVARPRVFFRPDGPMPEHSELQLAVPEGFAHDPDAYRDAVEGEVQRREAFVQAEMQQAARRFLGRKAVRRQSIDDRPSTREPRRTLNPQIAAKDVALRKEAMRRLNRFVADYRNAWAQWRDGVLDIVFPAGTYLARIQLGVACAPSG